ncbi:hypothetical protein DMJ13_22025 [halophilic archaeon]|nr:hypothetical protein DMJ13_22025 [halophilic archaeon]
MSSTNSTKTPTCECTTAVAELRDEIATLRDEVADLRQANAALREENERKAEQIKELEESIEDERKTKEKLRDQIADVEQSIADQPTIEFREDNKNQLTNLWIESTPVGKLIDKAHRSIKDTKSRIEDLERGEIDVDDVLDHEGTENQLPIQRDNAARKADAPADLSENKERATHVWAAFHECSRPGHGKLRLPSWLVKQILDDNDCPTDPNTVRRVMEFVAKGTGQNDDPHPEDDSNLITLKRGNRRNTLVADQDEWESFFAEQMQQAASMNDDAQSDEDEEESTDDDAPAENVNVEMDALSSASAVTSDENDSVDGEITVS